MGGRLRYLSIFVSISLIYPEPTPAPLSFLPAAQLESVSKTREWNMRVG